MTDLASWMRAGVKVVCITECFDAILSPLPVPTRVPMLGEVLTIATVRCSEPHIGGQVGPYLVLNGGGVFFTFDEIPEAQSAEGVTAWFRWRADMFRPLITTEVSEEADVALFASALKTAKPEVDA